MGDLLIKLVLGFPRIDVYLLGGGHVGNDCVEVKGCVFPSQFSNVTHYDCLTLGPEGLPLDVTTVTHVPDHPVLNSEGNDVCNGNC